MPEPARNRAPMTIEEFLAFDDGTDIRYELHGGYLVAMNPPAPPHGRIAQNVGSAIDRRSPDPERCGAYQAIGFVVDHANADYFVPDVVYSCEIYDGSGYLKAPRLVVEILSPTTERKDFRVKVPAYAALPSIEEIWLVASEERWVQVWSCIEGRWVVALPVRTGSFESRVLGDQVTLDELYRGAGMPVAPPAESHG